MPHRFKLVNASWTSKTQVRLLLSHDWPEDESLPPLYFNSEECPIINLQRPPLSLFGELTGYFRKEEGTITFLCPFAGFEYSKKIYVAGSFNNWADAIGQQEWRLRRDNIDGKQVLALTIPWESCHNAHIQSFFKFVTEDKVWLQVPVTAPNFSLDSNKNSNYKINPNCTGHNAFVFTPPTAYDPSIFNQILWIDEYGHYTFPLDDNAMLLSLGSTQALGSIVDNSSTTFRLFAPRAKTVKVTFYDQLNASISETCDLNRNADYTWELIYPKNLNLNYYHYTVSGDKYTEIDFKILDPYALATIGPEGPGIIIDTHLIPKINNDFKVPKWIDLVILEAHVRDLVSNTSLDLIFKLQ